GFQSRGGMFIAANISASGGGGAPRYTEILDPDGNPYVVDPAQNSNINLHGNPFNPFHNGLIITWGTATFSGSVDLYGSIYTARGFLGNGNPRVVYNYRM